MSASGSPSFSASSVRAISMKRRYAMLETTPPQSVSKNITCTSVRMRGVDIGGFQISNLRFQIRPLLLRDAQRMIRRQLQEQFFIEGRGAPPLFGLAQRAFSQVSLPFNLRVLQMICPRTQLFGA